MSLYRREGLASVGGVPLGTTEMEKKFPEEHYVIIIISIFNIIVETYLKPSCASAMDCFCRNNYRLLDINYFHKKAPS